MATKTINFDFTSRMVISGSSLYVTDSFLIPNDKITSVSGTMTWQGYSSNGGAVESGAYFYLNFSSWATSGDAGYLWAIKNKLLDGYTFDEGRIGFIDYLNTRRGQSISFGVEVDSGSHANGDTPFCSVEIDKVKVTGSLIITYTSEVLAAPYTSETINKIKLGYNEPKFALGNKPIVRIYLGDQLVHARKHIFHFDYLHNIYDPCENDPSKNTWTPYFEILLQNNVVDITGSIGWFGATPSGDMVMRLIDFDKWDSNKDVLYSDMDSGSTGSLLDFTKQGFIDFINVWQDRLSFSFSDMPDGSQIEFNGDVTIWYD